MAATIVDEVETEGTEVTEGIPTSYDDLVSDEKPEEVAPEQEVEEEEDDLPEKYQGKTRAEIARMHTEAEKAIGRQSSEVGELRAAFDEFVTSSIKEKNAVVEEPEDETDFFIDPKAAVQRAIDNHPKLRQAEAVTAEMQKRESLATLKAQFPDMQKTLQDPLFVDWVKASPVRRRLWASADTNYDAESAAELFSNWGERAEVVSRAKEVEKQHQANEVRNASTGTARGNPDAKRVKKTYRRADIRRLMNSDPARYEAMEAEILLAYSEGRVK